MDTRGEKKKRTSNKNVDERSTRSHDNQKFRSRSVVKQGGMAFGFRKTATAVIKPDRYLFFFHGFFNESDSISCRTRV
jgi:hypothetical protein